MLVGIDYGSRNAGTTVLCIELSQRIHFFQSAKNKDADAFLEAKLSEFKPDLVVIDAPLSLPLAYYETDQKDYHYRQCDREARAMSPMFLGGLTARAMSLVSVMQGEIKFIEGYPKLLAEYHDLINKEYKKDKDAIDDVTGVLEHHYSLELEQRPMNWHQVDALLAFLIAFRYQKEEAISLGNPKEGLIYY